MADSTVRIFRKAFKYRLYPTKEQIRIFESWFDICRELYNAALEERRNDVRDVVRSYPKR